REFRELDIEVKPGSSVLDKRKLQDFLAGHYLEEIHNWHSLSLCFSLSHFSPRNWPSIRP
ncbi:MAG: hypothetical protein MJE68_33725, partial [Proteobacteria bacterium]|nr:hypothetical protein [Pseudomonadota bacterium]